MWTESERAEVIKSLAVVCEVTGTDLSQPAKLFVVEQLAARPARQVLKALSVCAQECRFKLTLADIVQRIDDGRPGAEEAWGAFPKSEEAAGVVSDEMSVAWGAAAPLFGSDEVAARMAFREVYEREVRAARAAGIAPVWRVSPGFNRKATESVALEAVKLGRLRPVDVEPYVLPENRPADWWALPEPSATPRVQDSREVGT
jgi:hypothetical protein